MSAFALACLVALGIHSRHARYDLSYRTMAPHSTPEFAEFEEFTKIFGVNNDTYLIAFRAEPLLTNTNLRRIQRLTRALEELPHTRSVVSLTNADDIVGQDGTLEVIPFVEHMPYPEDRLAALGERLRADPVIGGNLISKDGTTTVVVVRIPESQMEFDERFAHFDAVEAILAEVRADAASTGAPPLEFHIVGYPYAGSVLMRYMIDDTSLFIPLTILVMGGLLWIVFGRPRAAVLALLPVAIAAVLTLGLLSGFGYPMSLLTGQGVLTTLILVIGLADGVHLLNRYDEDVRADDDRPRFDALRTTVGHVGKACLLTSLTTAVGFLSLAIADVPSVSDFGLFGAAGIFFAYLGAVVLLPALLVIIERHRPAPPVTTTTSAALDRLLAATARFVIARPRTILVSALALLATAATMIPSARIDNGITRDLRDSSPPIQAIRFLEARLGGVYPLDIVFGGGAPDSIKDPVLLQAVDRIANGLERSPYISKVNTPVEYIMKMNRAMHDGQPAEQRLPDTAQAVAQYLLLFEMAGSDSEFERLITYDYSVGRMQAMTIDIRPGQYREIEAEIERLKAKHLPAGAELYASGESPVWQTAAKVLIGTLVRSLYLAMPIIFLVTSFAFRSAKLGLISALPNLLPLTVGLGLLAPLDISLRFSTITAFPIAFGLAIDDTIHFLARYRIELAAGHSIEDAIRRTLATTGRAMFLTSALLVGGFSILFFSNFLGIIHVALLNCIILVAALFGDLLLLPALLLVLRPKVPLST